MTIGTIILIVIGFLGISVVSPFAFLMVKDPDSAQVEFEEYEDGE